MVVRVVTREEDGEGGEDGKDGEDGADDDDCHMTV